MNELNKESLNFIQKELNGDFEENCPYKEDYENKKYKSTDKCYKCPNKNCFRNYDYAEFVLMQSEIDVTDVILNAANDSDFENEIKEINSRLKQFSNSESPEIPLQFIFRENVFKYLNYIGTCTVAAYSKNNDIINNFL